MSLSLGHKSGGRYTLTFLGRGLKDEGLKHLPRGLHLEDNLTFKGDKDKSRKNETSRGIHLWRTSLKDGV